MKWYVYGYFNPLKINENAFSEFEPFYIGKGKDSRMFSHIIEKNLLKDKNIHKTNTIRKILEQGISPIIIKLIETDSEEAAYEEEKKIIALFGRRDNKTGCLTNMTDGGEGKTNVVVSDHTRKLLSEGTRKAHKDGKLKNNTIMWLKAGNAKAHSPSAIKKSAQSRKGLKASDETKYKISTSRKKYVASLTQDQRNEKFGTMRNKKASDETRKLLSISLRTALAAPAAKEKRSLANSGSRNPRAKPLTVFGKTFSYFGEAEKITGISKYLLKQEKSFNFL